MICQSHTCINEELVGHSWMIHIMDSTGKQSSHDLKICEHILKVKNKHCQYQDIFVFKVNSYEHCVYVYTSKQTSRAGVERRTCVDCTTSAAWMLLW